MKIYYSLDDFTRLDFAVVTSGTFDGVHLGHQKILQRLRETAAKNNGETVVITFWPHPRFVLKPEGSPLKLLNTFEEKAALLKAQGIQHLIRIPFTKEFSQLTSIDFIRRILVDTIGTRKLVIGYDHRFGKNREGSFEQLMQDGPQYGFTVEEIPRQDVDHVAVSSSNIRKALEAGDVAAAAHGLGRPYSLTGRVIKGDKLGRLIGFPTANLDIDAHDKLIPADGIYAVKILQESSSLQENTSLQGASLLQGMLYIGYRPTVDGKVKNIEVNIFDFDRDIYGETLTVQFIASIRQDSKFTDLEALRIQMEADKVSARKILGA